MTQGITARTFANLTERLRDLHERMLAVSPEVDRVACALYDRNDDLLKTFINSTRSGVALQAYQYKLSDSASLSALAATGEVRLIDGIQQSLHANTPHSKYILDQGYQSSLTVPLMHQGDFIGILFFDSLRTGTFTPQVVRELLLHANVIAMAIANEQLAVRSIVGTVLFARDLTKLRDMETGEHLERMSRYARIVARGIAPSHGLSDEFVEQVFLYAPLHDIGKIGIPDRILLKPAKLDAEEWAIMQTHPVRGREMVDHLATDLHMEHISDHSVMQNVVEFHHEMLDGSGYPRGLRGEEIPLESRIVAVADIFDALTSVRPYKQAWSVPDAFDELRSMVRLGKLDESCVTALAADGDEVERIRMEYLDTEAPGEMPS